MATLFVEQKAMHFLPKVTNRGKECNRDCEGGMDLLLHTPTERVQIARATYDISQTCIWFWLSLST